jgi:nitrogen fixation protein FixH
MATLASTTFGGVVVENSYVASQHFNRWLDEAAAEKALGWHAQTARTANDHLSIKLSGLSSGTVLLAAIARHPLGRAPDQSLTFVKQADGAFLSVERLPPGRWRLRLEVTTRDRLWRTEGDVQ